MFIAGVVTGLALYGLFALSRCQFRIEEGYLGALSAFGAALRKPDGTLVTYGPGLHAKRPWHHVHRVAVMEQSLDLSGERSGRVAMAEDGTTLRIDSILRYEPVERELEALLFGFRAPIEHITGLFTCLLRNEIANFGADPQAGSYALLRKERARLNARIQAFCQAEIGERYGVRFNAVDLTDILPPDELADALNAVIHARSEAETLYFHAEADCRQRVMAAERGVDIARARSRAVETEMVALGGFLADLHAHDTLNLYVQRRRDEVLSESRTLFLKEAP